MKILLVADVGTNAAGFYHIGDEAMLYQTAQWYRQHYPKIKLGVLSRSLSHQDLSVVEILHLPFPKADIWLESPWYCLSLLTRLIIYRSTGWPVLRKIESDFVLAVAQFDCLHFVGGGNIYSQHAPWLYYVFFLLFLGKQLNKKIWLTSQTLGPFNWFDGYLAAGFLSLSDVIVLRGKHSPLSLTTAVGLDAAYDLETLGKKVLPKKPSQTFRIGLSLHEWQNFAPRLRAVVVSALKQLARTQKIQLVILPHVFTVDLTEWDPGYMTQISRDLPPEISLTTVLPIEIMQAREPAVFIKTITSELDLMIATRYHALVFALSSNVPVVTFELDEYYSQKNSQLLELVYQRNWQSFVLSLDGDGAKKQLNQTIQAILQNLVQEKNLLKKQNYRLHQDQNLHQLSPLVATLSKAS